MHVVDAGVDDRDLAIQAANEARCAPLLGNTEIGHADRVLPLVVRDEMDADDPRQRPKPLHQVRSDANLDAVVGDLVVGEHLATEALDRRLDRVLWPAESRLDVLLGGERYRALLRHHLGHGLAGELHHDVDGLVVSQTLRCVVRRLNRVPAADRGRFLGYSGRCKGQCGDETRKYESDQRSERASPVQVCSPSSNVDEQRLSLLPPGGILSTQGTSVKRRPARPAQEAISPAEPPASA